MCAAERGDSVFDEPHMRPGAGAPLTCSACGYSRAGLDATARCPECGEPALEVEHGAWDEPVIVADARAAERRPAEALTYSTWLAEKRAGTPRSTTLAVTMLVALSAGPLGVLGALWGSGETAMGLVMVTVIGPVIEEVSKVMAATWVVEKRPYLFASAWQVLLCCAAGGLAFAAIENVLYLYVYFPKADAWLWAWRWTVCVALHAGCSTIAGLGLVRVWGKTMTAGSAPDLNLGTRFLVGAIVLHGVYNAMATLIR